MNMLFEYKLTEDLSKTKDPNAGAFYFIGGAMLLGGLVSLIMTLTDEGGFKSSEVILNIITTMGGVCFLIVANRNKKAQTNTVKYSIQINDKKIKTESGNGSKEMLTNEISKVDFKSNEISIYGKSDNKIIVDLELISPEEKKNELKKTLEDILKNNRI